MSELRAAEPAASESQPSGEPPVVHAVGLVKEFLGGDGGVIRILDDVSITVQRGEMVAVVGDQRRTLKPGDMVVVPRGRPHTYFNPLDRPTSFACIIFNRHLLDVFRDIDALTKQGTAAPDPAALVRALEQNQVGFAGPPVGPR